MLRLSAHAIDHLEMSVESLCVDFALFISDNATEINRIQEQQLLEVIQPGEDQKIISACNTQIVKQRNDGLGA
jgi:hypothetical protein